MLLPWLILQLISMHLVFLEFLVKLCLNQLTKGARNAMVTMKLAITKNVDYQHQLVVNIERMQFTCQHTKENYYTFESKLCCFVGVACDH